MSCSFWTLVIFGSIRSSINANLRPFVCLMKSVLELSIFIFLSQLSIRSVSGQSQVVSGQSQVSPRSVSGQSQVSLRSGSKHIPREFHSPQSSHLCLPSRRNCVLAWLVPFPTPLTPVSLARFLRFHGRSP